MVTMDFFHHANLILQRQIRFLPGEPATITRTIETKIVWE